MNWLFEIIGDFQTLETISKLKDVEGLQIRRDTEDHFYIVIPQITFPYLVHAEEEACRILDRANRLVGLRTSDRGINPARYAGKFFRDLPDGSYSTFVAAPCVPYQAGETSIVRFEDGRSPIVNPRVPSSRLETMLNKFADDLMVVRVIDLLIDRNNRPTNLFKIYELIGMELNTVAQRKELDKSTFRNKWIENGWIWWIGLKSRPVDIDWNELVRFRKSLHSESAVGPSARHAIDASPPGNPMTEDQCFDFMHHVVEQWLEWRLAGRDESE